VNRNGKPQSVLGVYCVEHAAEIAVRKNLRQLPPMPVTEEEFERLHELRGLDPAEIKFMDKHEGSPFFFINGQLNCPRRAKDLGGNETDADNNAPVGPVEHNAEPGDRILGDMELVRREPSEGGDSPDVTVIDGDNEVTG
jgi:hypothetical protein